MATVTDSTIPSPPPLVSFADSEFETWLRHRQECGGDRGDEVWDGVYVVMPMGNIQHQELITRLSYAFIGALIDTPGARVFAGCNVSDDASDWTKNYRCPDVAVYMPGNPAEARQAYWLGGPDFAVEIVSKYDRSREKFDFYSKVGVRELLFVDRHPTWSLELFRRDGQAWTSSGTVDQHSPQELTSEVLPISFRLIESQPHPRIEVARRGTDLRWLA